MALLTRARIVDEAVALVEQSGHEKLSLRGLAATLGVTAPALYDHLSSKDEVLQAVAAMGYQGLEAAYDEVEGRAIERVRERALAYVRFARDNPELFRLMFMFRPQAVAIEARQRAVGGDHRVRRRGRRRRGGDRRRRPRRSRSAAPRPDPLGLDARCRHDRHDGPPIAEAVADDVIDALLTGLRPT